MFNHSLTVNKGAGIHQNFAMLDSMGVYIGILCSLLDRFLSSPYTTIP